MGIVFLAGRLLLAGIFMMAGVTKLADQRSSRQALSDFGVPRTLIPTMSVALPLSELAVALALIPQPTAWLGALGAFFLLVIFMGGIANQLAHGRAPDCHCFGQLHSEPVGWSTLARNAVLAAVSGLIIIHGPSDPGLSPVAWLGALSVVERVIHGIAIVAVAAVIALAWMMTHLLRQNGRLLLRVEAIEAHLDPSAVAEAGLPVGTNAPSFQLPNLQGDIVTLAALISAGRPTLLTFIDPACGPCTALLPDLATYQRDQSEKLTIAIISTEREDLIRAKALEHGLDHVLLEHNREVAENYQAGGTPSAVLIWPDGTIGSPIAQGSEQVRSLVDAIVGPDSMPRNPKRILLPIVHEQVNGHAARHESAVMLKAGDVAPAITLPDLEGATIDLADFSGGRVIVLFWNPACGFCQRMLPDVKAWEDQRSAHAPRMLVVSTGTPEMNIQQGLQSPIVFDEGFSTGYRYGMGGTPSGILIDEHGKLAAPPAIGLPQVQALLNDVKHATTLIKEKIL